MLCREAAKPRWLFADSPVLSRINRRDGRRNVDGHYTWRESGRDKTGTIIPVQVPTPRTVGGRGFLAAELGPQWTGATLARLFRCRSILFRPLAKRIGARTVLP